jgi:hypothetical protein
MNQNQPVTRTELNAALANFGTELKTELTEELTTVMRGIETHLLTAFHSYARANAARLGVLDITDREIRIRMDEPENRMLELETRRPPNG